MAVPAAINRASAVGRESTYGVAVPITKRFSSFGLSAARQYNIGEVRPPGSKYPTKHFLSGEWSEYSIEDGVLSYDEIIDPLSGIFRKTIAGVPAPTGDKTTLTAGITSGATTVPVASAALFPGSGTYKIRVEDEVMQVTAGQGTLSWTVTRAQNGTTAKAHPLGAVVEELVGVAGAYSWVYDSNSFARDPNQSFTIETGDTDNNRGGQAVGGEFVEWGFEVSRDGDTAEMTGSMIAQEIVAGALTASGITLADFQPIVPRHFDVYLDTTLAGLGTTRLTGAFNLGFSIGDRRNPIWVFNRAKKGYTGTVEQAPSQEITLTVGDEATPVDDIMTNLAAGTRLWLRFLAEGPAIGATGINHKFLADFACQVSDAPGDDEEQEAQVKNFTFGVEQDGSWGKPFRFEVINSLAALP